MTRGRRAAGVVQLGSGSAAQRPVARRQTLSGAPAVHGVTEAFLRLSERQFQAILRGTLEGCGFVVWTVPNMKLTTAGLPDLTFWHPARPGVLHAWELKRERDYRVTPAQRAAIAHLSTVPGIDARIVRPSQWPELRDSLIAPVLRGAAGEDER